MIYKKLSFPTIICFMVAVITISFKPEPSESENIRLILSTDLGQMKIRLYDETPLHRDNFVKLVQQAYFDDFTFYRILQHFVLQGGNPSFLSPFGMDSLLTADTITAEIKPQFFHKKGALAAGRKNDFENPTKASSPFQFFIVQGNVYKESMLDKAASRITKSNLFNDIINRPENENLNLNLKRYSNPEQLDSLKIINELVMKQVEIELPNSPAYSFSEAQIKAYTSIGGTPHLDNGYTVFGEVYEGLEIIDKIAKLPVGKDGKPVDDIHLKISILH